MGRRLAGGPIVESPAVGAAHSEPLTGRCQRNAAPGFLLQRSNFSAELGRSSMEAKGEERQTVDCPGVQRQEACNSFQS